MKHGSEGAIEVFEGGGTRDKRLLYIEPRPQIMAFRFAIAMGQQTMTIESKFRIGELSFLCGCWRQYRPR
jgi:hypothetical protein